MLFYGKVCHRPLWCLIILYLFLHGEDILVIEFPNRLPVFIDILISLEFPKDFIVSSYQGTDGNRCLFLSQKVCNTDYREMRFLRSVHNLPESVPPQLPFQNIQCRLIICLILRVAYALNISAIPTFQQESFITSQGRSLCL